jgi:hypothetical protein
MRTIATQQGGRQILNSGLHVSEQANPDCGCCGGGIPHGCFIWREVYPGETSKDFTTDYTQVGTWTHVPPQPGTLYAESLGVASLSLKPEKFRKGWLSYALSSDFIAGPGATCYIQLDNNAAPSRIEYHQSANEIRVFQNGVEQHLETLDPFETVQNLFLCLQYYRSDFDGEWRMSGVARWLGVGTGGYFDFYPGPPTFADLAEVTLGNLAGETRWPDQDVGAYAINLYLPNAIDFPTICPACQADKCNELCLQYGTKPTTLIGTLNGWGGDGTCPPLNGTHELLSNARQTSGLFACNWTKVSGPPNDQFAIGLSIDYVTQQLVAEVSVGLGFVVGYGSIPLPLPHDCANMNYTIPLTVDGICTTTDPNLYISMPPGGVAFSGSVGAMAMPTNPDCKPEIRRGKPVIPKGKRRG